MSKRLKRNGPEKVNWGYGKKKRGLDRGRANSNEKS